MSYYWNICQVSNSVNFYRTIVEKINDYFFFYQKNSPGGICSILFKLNFRNYHELALYLPVKNQTP